MADEVVNEWPNRYLEKVGDDLGPRDAVCVLTHDSKFDVPAIVGSLATRVGYLGAMGSRTTHAKRTERLREAGVTDEELARIHAPIGLDIGARTPEETAVSICAEIISARTGRKAQALARRDRADPLVNFGIEGRRAAVAAASSGLGFATAPRPRRRRGHGRRSAAGRGSGSRPRRRRSVHSRCRWWPTSSTEEGAAGFVHGRARRAGRRRHPRVQRWRPAARQLRVHAPRGLPRRDRAQLPRATSRCATRRCRRCASSGGGG